LIVSRILAARFSLFSYRSEQYLATVSGKACQLIPFLHFYFQYSLAIVLIILLQEDRSWGCHVNSMALLASTSGGGGVVRVVGVAMVFLGLQPVVCLARRTWRFYLDAKV